MSIWKIQGEAGKAIGEELYEPAELAAENLQLKIGSLSDDQFEFVQVFGTIGEARVAKRFLLAQKVALFRNGICVFRGIVSGEKVAENDKGLRIFVRCSGPWWWLSQTPLLGAMTDGAGDEMERAKITLAEGNLRAQIRTVLERSIELGCPIRVGQIDPGFDLPQLSFSNQSCADALAELLRWLPDAVGYFDYGQGLPAFCVRRRAYAPVFELDAGTDGDLKSYDLAPRLDLSVDEVELKWVERDEQWRTVFKEDRAGASPAARPARQVVTISGPELGDFLPTDKFESVVLQTSTNQVSITQSLIPFEAVNEEFSKTSTGQGLGSTFSYSNFIQGTLNDANGTFSNVFGFPHNNASLYDLIGASGFTFRLSALIGGANIPTAGAYILTQGEAKEWLAELGITVQKALLKCSVAVAIGQSAYSALAASNKEYFDALGGAFGGTLAFANGTAGLATRWWYGVLEREVSYLSFPLVSATTYYRKAEYNFISPPGNLAAELLAAQNWLPYEGNVTLESEEVLERAHLGHVLNLRGSLPEYERMHALIQSVSYDIDGGGASLQIGAPARLSASGLVRRFRRSPQDNIIEI